MRVRRTAGVMAGVGLAVALGGVVLDRTVGLRTRKDEDDDTVALGSLRGDRYEVTTKDGLVLHAEVDQVAPFGSEADHGDRVTVVFVHGFALNLDCWHFQRQAFRGKRRMVFYDQRSHGRSQRSEPEHATIDQLGEDLRVVLDTLAPDEKVVLVGHSMGGMTIVALAEQHPELFGSQVVGLGLISTTAGGQRTHKILSRYIPDALGRRVVERGLLLAAQRERVLELVRKRGSAVALRMVREFAFGDRPVPTAYVEFVDRMIGSTPLQVLVQFIPQFDALDKFSVVAAFSRVPTWIVCGTDDRLTSIDHARKLNESIGDSHLVELEGGGHVPILEFKDRVNEILEQLFEAADQRASGER
jgi:pimeloyl-ACP methyl ester carboxylesterase